MYRLHKMYSSQARANTDATYSFSTFNVIAFGVQLCLHSIQNVINFNLNMRKEYIYNTIKFFVHAYVVEASFPTKSYARLFAANEFVQQQT